MKLSLALLGLQFVTLQQLLHQSHLSVDGCNVTMEYVQTDSTTTTDRVCGIATLCADDQFESSALQLTADRICTNTSMCNFDFQFQQAPQTTTTDRDCVNCGSCLFGEYISVVCSNTSDVECQPCTCQNGGRCFPSLTQGYFCECPNLFYGDSCEKVDPCDEWWMNVSVDGWDTMSPEAVPCLNNGVCINDRVNDTYTCECDVFHDGARCESIVCSSTTNPCESIPNTDGCLDSSCLCLPGYHGTFCDSVETACQPNPCQNGGSCDDTQLDIDIDINVDGMGNNSADESDRTQPNEAGSSPPTAAPADSFRRARRQGLDFTCTCPVTFSGATCNIAVAPSPSPTTEPQVLNSQARLDAELSATLVIAGVVLLALIVWLGYHFYKECIMPRRTVAEISQTPETIKQVPHVMSRQSTISTAELNDETFVVNLGKKDDVSMQETNLNDAELHFARAQRTASYHASKPRSERLSTRVQSDDNRDGIYDNVDPTRDDEYQRNSHDVQQTASLQRTASYRAVIQSQPRRQSRSTAIGDALEENTHVSVPLNTSQSPNRVPLSTSANAGFWCIAALIFVSIVLQLVIQISASYNPKLALDFAWSSFDNTTIKVAFSLEVLATQDMVILANAETSEYTAVSYDIDSACAILSDTKLASAQDEICNSCNSAGENVYKVLLFALAASFTALGNLAVSAHSKNDVALGMRHTTLVFVIALGCTTATLVIWNLDCHRKLTEQGLDWDHGPGFNLTLATAIVQGTVLLFMFVWIYSVSPNHAATDKNKIHWPYFFNHGPNKSACGVTISGWTLAGLSAWLTVASVVITALLLVPVSTDLRVLSAIHFGTLESNDNTTNPMEKLFFGLGGFGVYNQDTTAYTGFGFPVNADSFCAVVTSEVGYNASEHNCISYDNCQLCLRSMDKTVGLVASSIGVTTLHAMYSIWRHCHCSHVSDLDGARMASASAMFIGVMLTCAAIFRFEFDCFQTIAITEGNNCTEDSTLLTRGDAFGGLCSLMVLQCLIAFLEASIGVQ